MKENNLDIIIPCFNPLKDWHKTILFSYKKIRNTLIDTNISIILINDGSSNGVSNREIDFLKENIANFTFINLKQNRGKGNALRQGFKKSKAEFIIFTDIDFPYKEGNLFDMFAHLQKNADLVIGIRSQEYYQKVPLFRTLISKSFKKIIKIVFQIPTSDTQAGLKAFSLKGKEMLLKTKTDRYLFDLELIKLAAKDKSIKFAYTELNLKDNIVLSKLSIVLLMKEFKNLIKILFL